MSRLVQQNFENDVCESICLLDADSSSYPRVDDDFTVWRMAMKHETGLIIFISQISRSNSKGSFYAFDNNKRFSSESYYSERIGLPQVVICPGNGVKINNVLQNIQNVECSFRSNGGKSETSMDVVKEKMVSMRMLDEMMSVAKLTGTVLMWHFNFEQPIAKYDTLSAGVTVNKYKIK